MLQTKRYLGPTQDGLAVKELYNAGLDYRRPIVRDYDGGDDGVTVIVESNRQCRLSCAKWTGDRVRPAAALHPRDGDRMAGTQNRMLVAHQVEVAQAIELVVIGYTGRAIAEADLRPNIKVDLGSAVSRLAQECFALTPLVRREGPLHLGPNRMAGRKLDPAAVRRRPREQRDCASQPAQSEGDDRGNDGSSFHRVTDRDRMRRCS